MTETALEELVAVDVHTHVLASTYRAGPEDPALKSLASVFGFDHVPTLPEMIDYYRVRNMAFVTFTVDDVTRAGVEPPVGNLEILELAGKYPDVVIPFASVDPNRGTAAVRIATELLDEHGARGLKFHPSQQQFYPNDRAHYPLYELLTERGLPALFHTGTTGVGRGQPGGGGIRLKYSNPIYLDDVAADFSELPIIMAHPSFPWQEEALAVATHKPQVYIDLSGWSPKYFPPVLVQHINTLLKDRVLFGSDFPLITPERWIRDFDTLGVKPEVRSLVLKENAMRLLDLSDLLEARRVRQAENALSDDAASAVARSD